MPTNDLYPEGQAFMPDSTPSPDDLAGTVREHPLDRTPAEVMAMNENVGRRLRGVVKIANRMDPEYPDALAEQAWLIGTVNDVTDYVEMIDHAFDRETAALLTRVQEAERERDLIGAALGEPCAECGHIDWRSDGYTDRFRRAESALRVAREGLERIANVAPRRPDGTYNFDREALRQMAEVTLAAVSQAEEGE